MPDTTAATRVIKKLDPRQPGALRWARKFGPTLVCVRYRLGAEGRRRYTTVELIVDEAPLNVRQVSVRTAVGEAAVRCRIMSAGGLWDAKKKLWRIAQKEARALGLLDRVVEE